MTNGLPFHDRSEAGRRLVPLLSGYAGAGTVVLGLPRGGVVTAVEVARGLGAPLDVLVAHKIGAPGHHELAIGAVAEGGVAFVNRALCASLGVGTEQLRHLTEREVADVSARARRLRGGRPLTPLGGKVALLVDDGLATGATARAAAEAARRFGASRVVLAVPVAPAASLDADALGVDRVVCAATPGQFVAVGLWYKDFGQVSDEEVVHALDSSLGDRHPMAEALTVDAGPVRLPGELTVPVGAHGVVIFAHGSGSSRRSPRNRDVARALNDAGLATLLFDLLSPAEESDRRKVFDVPVLAQRLVAATDAVTSRLGDLPIGYFGASTGAAAALWAAAELGASVTAVVSRGGRPDLAGPRLGRVVAPTLFIVGGLDVAVLELTREARHHLAAPNELRIVPGATHLFSEPGALDAVADLAAAWFTRHFAAQSPRVVA